MKGKLVCDTKDCDGRQLKKGKVVYMYPFCTYGVISHSGVAVTDIPVDKEGESPFYEIPAKTVEWEEKTTQQLDPAFASETH